MTPLISNLCSASRSNIVAGKMLYHSRFFKAPTSLLAARVARAVPFSTFRKRDAYKKALKERTERTASLQEKQWTLETIVGKFDRGEINLFPNYQRGFKWKPPEASKLVLTVLGERFVPAVVIHRKEDNTYDVVDGKQRLSSLLSFRYGSKSEGKGLPDAAAILQGLGEDDDDLVGLTFDQLSEPRRRQFNDYSLDMKIIPKETSDDTVFAIYEDINSGGSKLSAHQLRRAAFYGPYIELIDKLVHDDNFRAILGADFDESNDGEMILRAFAVCSRHSDFKLPWKRFMNKELIAVRDMNQSHQQKYLAEREDEFEFVMRQARDVFGKTAFRKYDGQTHEWAKKVDVAGLWSSLYCVLASGRKLKWWSDVNLTKNSDSLKEVFALAYKNHPSFLSLFSAGKVSAKILDTRRTVLRGIIEPISKGASAHEIDISGLINDMGPRGFSRKGNSIQDLFDKQHGKCGICHQEIDGDRLDNGAYVHIDHIKPYSRGGQTTKKNSQLVHAKCNQSKGGRAMGRR